MYAEIKKIVRKTVKKYGSGDPFKIAEKMNIIILYEEFENIRGFYNKCYRQKFIHLNSRLSKEQMMFTLSHEIGHAVLHPDTNTYVLQKNIVYRYGKEADIFAGYLLDTL